jgi:hypothetical protein
MLIHSRRIFVGDNAGLTVTARVLLAQALSRYDSNVKAQASFMTGVHALGLLSELCRMDPCFRVRSAARLSHVNSNKQFC